MNIIKNTLKPIKSELLNEWNYERNTEITPSSLSAGSKRKVWWKCSTCGHEWEAAISNRVNGSGCPVCAGKIVVSGYNDLQTWCISNNKQLILKEWDHEKNPFSPEDVTPFANKNAWFICREGHSFQAKISNRTKNNTGCPFCKRARRTSFPEQALYYYIKKHFPNAINSFHADWLGQSELDVFIPELDTAIEYDGVSWHKNKDKDIKKTKLCTENGVQLIRVRESGLDSIKGCKNVFLKAFTYDALDEVIIETLCLIGCIDIDVNTGRDTPNIVKQFDNSKKEKSIASQFPQLLVEWDYEKNAGVDPEYVNYGSMRKFWWICPICGNSWQMNPNARTNQGQGCPRCAGSRKVRNQMGTLLKKRGALEETNKLLLEEWDYEKNSLLPSQVTSGSKNKVWWKCKKCGGSWIAEVQNRSKEKGTGCPFCSGKKVKEGFNDLTVTHPELILEWNYDRNVEITPSSVTAGSKRKVWWKCSTCGHEWQATIHSRTSGKKCPICQRKTAARKNQVRIINLDTRVIYNSLSEAANSVNGGKSSICECCKGRQKKAYGYRWAYLNDTNEL